nr:MAG TPA: hypothetical protein [Caudoviricetes sp.]
MGVGRRLWGTLHEPRAISAMMAATYVLLAVAVALILGAPRIQPWDVTVGCLMTLCGCAIGAPSAWRGWWGVEGPSAALVALGLVVVAVEDAARALTSDHWPGWPLFVILALLLMIGQRMARVWGHTWEPGCEPNTALRQAETSAAAAKAIEADAAARAMEREDPGCRKPS